MVIRKDKWKESSMNSPQAIVGVRLAFFQLLVVSFVFSQVAPRGTISGRVVDDSTRTVLENVNVFLAHTTFGCGSNEKGYFEIRDVPYGSYELVASRIGYATKSLCILLSDASKRVDVDIRLVPVALQVGEVVISVSDPAEWKENLQKFIPLFLGTTPNARRCKILNPEVLDFKMNEQGKIEATARQPLEIDNLALGYHIRFHLGFLKVDLPEVNIQAHVTIQDPTITQNDRLTYEGWPEYSAMTPSSVEEGDQWNQNRSLAFKGSPRHFFLALFNGKLIEEGYVISLMPYLIRDEWNPKRRPVTADDLLSEGTRQYERQLKFKGVLEVEYTKQIVDPTFDLVKKRGTDRQTSWVSLRYNVVHLSPLGRMREPFPTLYSGYWAWKRIADALPLDYEPVARSPK